MTTFERFIEAIGNKEELEPFKFHLLDKPISLLDQYGHFHAGWAVAWVRKNDTSGDYIAYAMCASPVGAEVALHVLQQSGFKVRDCVWGDYDARLIPWVVQWLKNVPSPIVMKGGYLAASAKNPHFCEYCNHPALLVAAQYLYRAAGTESERRSCKRLDCKTRARADVARETSAAIWTVIETEINPFV
jgi:hypothetical protein